MLQVTAPFQTDFSWHHQHQQGGGSTGLLPAEAASFGNFYAAAYQQATTAAAAAAYQQNNPQPHPPPQQQSRSVFSGDIRDSIAGTDTTAFPPFFASNRRIRFAGMANNYFLGLRHYSPIYDETKKSIGLALS